MVFFVLRCCLCHFILGTRVYFSKIFLKKKVISVVTENPTPWFRKPTLYRPKTLLPLVVRDGYLSGSCRPVFLSLITLPFLFHSLLASGIKTKNSIVFISKVKLQKTITWLKVIQSSYKSPNKKIELCSWDGSFLAWLTVGIYGRSLLNFVKKASG